MGGSDTNDNRCPDSMVTFGQGGLKPKTAAAQDSSAPEA